MANEVLDHRNLITGAQRETFAVDRGCPLVFAERFLAGRGEFSRATATVLFASAELPGWHDFLGSTGATHVPVSAAMVGVGVGEYGQLAERLAGQVCNSDTARGKDCCARIPATQHRSAATGSGVAGAKAIGANRDFPATFTPTVPMGPVLGNAVKRYDSEFTEHLPAQVADADAGCNDVRSLCCAVEWLATSATQDLATCQVATGNQRFFAAGTAAQPHDFDAALDGRTCHNGQLAKLLPGQVLKCWHGFTNRNAARTCSCKSAKTTRTRERRNRQYITSARRLGTSIIPRPLSSGKEFA